MLLVCLRPWRLTTASVAGLGVRTGARRAGGGGITTSGVVDTVEGGGVVDTVGDGGVVGRLSASLLLKMLLSRAAAAIIGISGLESVSGWRAGVRCVARGNDDVTNDGVGCIVSGSGGVLSRSESLLLSNTAATASSHVGIGLGRVGAVCFGASGDRVTVVIVSSGDGDDKIGVGG